MKIKLIPIKYRVDGSHITIKERGEKWAVCDGYEVLNNKLEWEIEPQPSSRTDEFKARTRFAFEETKELLKKYFKNCTKVI